MAVVVPREVVAAAEAHPATRPASVRRVGGWFAATGVLFVVTRDGTWTWAVVRALTVLSLAVGVDIAMTRWARRGRAPVELVHGFVLVAVGVGIAVPHVAKTGVTAMSLAGVLALAGGVIVAAAGAGDLLGTWRWWQRALAAPALVLALAVVLYTVGQAVAFTNVPPTEVGRTTPADRGLEYVDVTFSSTDGVELSGWYVPSRNGAAIVLLHGAGSTRSGVLDHAVVLAEHGYGVLLFDARGHGRSAGRAMDAGWYGTADTSGAVTFLQAQPGVDPDRIGAVGMSMGGEQAVGAAGEDQRIRVVVGEGVEQRSAADKQWQVDEFGFRGWLQTRIDGLTSLLTDLLTDASPPMTLADALVAMAPRRALVIAGGDEPGEISAADRLEAVSPSNVEVWVVPDAGHTGGLRSAPDEWSRRVIAFLDAALL